MKKINKILSLILCFCMALSIMPAATVFEAKAQDIVVNDWTEFKNALSNDSVTSITLGQSISQPFADTNGDDAFIIDKNVVINGGGYTFTISSGGIVLGGDVTFNNITIKLNNPVRNAIIANGNALSLNNVSKAATTSIHLFCGGITDYTGSNTIPNPGSHGQITISGSGQFGNIYAGSLSDVTAAVQSSTNTFTGNATITVESSATGTVGNVFACGAREDRVGGNPDTFYNMPANYAVSGNVEVVLKTASFVKNVDGRTGSTTKNTSVEFSTTSQYRQELTLQNISALSVTAGHLHPTTAGALAGVSLSVLSGAKLDMSSQGNISVNNFTGGGHLILGTSQTLTITGTISNATEVAIGGISGTNTSTGQPAEGHTYITVNNGSTPAGTEFTFLQNTNFPDLTPTYSNNSWSTPGSTADDKIIVSDISINNYTAPAASPSIDIPITSVTYQNPDEYLGLAYVPVSIWVNGVEASRSGSEMDGFSYSTGVLSTDLELYIGGDVYAGEEAMSVLSKNYANITAGSYEVWFIIPGSNTENGSQKRVDFTFTVPSAQSAPISVNIPDAVPNLTYDGTLKTGVAANTGYTLTGNTAIDAGNYSAIATLETGYVWSDGTNGQKTIPWSISRATGSASVRLDNWTLGQNASTPVATSGSHDTVNGVTYQYKGVNEADTQYKDFITNPPAVAGEYILKAVFAQNTNYFAIEAQTTFSVLAPPALERIAITKQPTLVYNEGDGLDLSAMEITAYYNNSTTTTLTYSSSGVNVTIPHGTTLSKGTHNGTRIDVGYGNQTASTAALTVKSTNAGIDSVSISGTVGTINGNTVSVVLPFGTQSLPTDSGAVTVTKSDTAATVSGLATGDSGNTWTFTVTAESGRTENYTINVSIAQDEAAGNRADVAAAKAAIEQHNWTVAQTAANNETAVRTWIENELRGLNLGGVSYTLTMTQGAFTGAVQGTAAVPNGTNGRFGFTVSIEKGTGASLVTDTATVSGGIITATVYTPPAFVPVSSITGVPSTATAGTPLILTGTVNPTNATNYTIVWSVENAGTTGASINGNTFTAMGAGTATVKATVKNGQTSISDYTQTFTITVQGVNPPAAVTYTISVSAQPSKGGSVTGGGTYNENASVTLKATANSGYKFVNWTENGTVVSTNGELTFNAAGNRSLTAIFEEENKTSSVIQQVVNTNFTDAYIPQSLKDAGYDTTEKIISALKAEVTKLNSNAVNSVLYDITLMVDRKDGKGWVKAEEKDFPAGGRIKVSIGVPAGSDPTKHDYIVLHMFATNAFGKTPGTWEKAQVTERTDEQGNHYLDFYVTGLSPVMISWYDTVSAAPTTQSGGTTNATSSTSTSVPTQQTTTVIAAQTTVAETTKSPTTKDSNYLVLWMALVTVSAAGVIAVIVRKKYS